MGNIRKLIARGIVAAIAPVATMLFLATPALADSIQTFQNQNTGRCIVGINDGNATPFASPCNDGNNHVFTVHYWADGTRELQNGYSWGYCLADSWGYGLRYYPCDASTWQSWYVDYPGDGTIRLRNQETGKCIDDSWDYGLRHYDCHWGSYQRWY